MKVKAEKIEIEVDVLEEVVEQIIENKSLREVVEDL